MKIKFLSILVISLIVGLMQVKSADAVALCFVDLQLHNPPGGNTNNPEGSNSKSQFVMYNGSTTNGVQIESILWEFASGVFIDSTAAAPGYGSFLDYTLSPAATYSSTNTITVLANSDTIVGYTGPTHLTNGATTLFLTFNDFDPGEAFGFWTDLDSTGNNKGFLTNTLLDGSKVTVAFSNGESIPFIFDLPDNNGRTIEGEVEGKCCETTTNPEPASMLLFGSGLVGFALKRKKLLS